MRMKALELFVELSQAESIRQVARTHGVKPSAISRQIEAVEYFFRTELFDRGVEGITLTESGRLLVDHARTILADVRTARAIIDDLRKLDRGQVSVYAGGAASAGLLAPVVAELHIQYPGLRFQIQVASADEVFTAVAEGRADLGLTIFSPETTKVDICSSHLIQHHVIVAPHHPLARESHVSLQMLATTTLALPETSYGARRRLESLAAESGLTIDPIFTSSSLETQKELALRGAAALVLPTMCCSREIDAGLLCAVPFESSDYFVTSLDLCCAHGRPLPFAVRKLATALGQALEAHG